MTKYFKSPEGLPSQLHLWDPLPTQTAIMETKQVEIYPNNSLDSSDTVSFTIPAMQYYMLDKVQIVTELRVLTENGENPPKRVNVSTAPHLAASLWRNVEVDSGGVAISQSFDNAYSMFKFWDDVIHYNHDSRPFMKKREGLNLDSVGGKFDSENLDFFPAAPEAGTPAPEPKNKNGQERAEMIEAGNVVYLVSDFNIPMFKQNKLLPTGLQFNVKLTKNFPEYILLAEDSNEYQIHFDKIALRCTYQRPVDPVLNILEERLAKENAIYHADRKTMFVRPVPRSQSIEMDNLFNGPLPYFFLVGVQDRAALGKTRSKNPFSLHMIKKAQLYINGQEHFARDLQMTDHLETNMFNEFVEQSGSKGDSFVSHHYRVYPALAFDLTQDKSQNQNGLNLGRHGNVRIVLETMHEPAEDQVLVVLAWYEQVVEISKDRQLHII